ncbi:hypothetical protein C8R44DRAFT_752888 [Mycena epipterygia]|nr:hypothetical protein C8R44DRAFT_752888 [Mycena epipterygia]
MFVERGCAVCGWLVNAQKLTSLSEYKGSLELLVQNGVTRKERFQREDPIEEYEGPILAENCTDICVDCETYLNNRVVPKFALCRHNWVGPVPVQLQGLQVNSGRVRMSANAVMFSQPVLSIYNKLPPSRAEMNEVLAFVFTGSSAPTQGDFDRTPMLVRRQKVLDALEWLKLNHEGYTDLEISKENLDSYEERGIPVVVDYRRTNREVHDSVPAGATAVNEVPEEQGTSTGVCTFAVHGLTGAEYSTASMTTIKAVALQHLTHQGKMLGIGRSADPVSMYDNVGVYPGMFPLVIFLMAKVVSGHPTHHAKQGDMSRKKSLLMYHDKRFQMDTYFPMVAFNHEQLKAASTGSKLLAKRPKFAAISRRLSAVKPDVAEDIANRLSKDLDAVAGHVMGSVTTKKYMRNEIWSTIAFFNTPSGPPYSPLTYGDLGGELAIPTGNTRKDHEPRFQVLLEGSFDILKIVIGQSFLAVLRRRPAPPLNLLQMANAHPPTWNPTLTLPLAPPVLCSSNQCVEPCRGCHKRREWWTYYRQEVDDLLALKKDWKGIKRKKKLAFKIRRDRKGCLTRTNVCRARFPRDRCNTDVTSMLSGTAVKAVVAYISDYIAKLSLKSYQMFASVYHVFEKNSEMLGGNWEEKDTARHLMRKMVNSMSSKMEIGSPMASMYLLGHPDHYASHKYVTFWWKAYVLFVRSFWLTETGFRDSDDEEAHEKVPIGKQDGIFVATSGVDDYRYRPVVYNNVTLYEWIQCSEKKARNQKERIEFEDELRLAKYMKADYYRAAIRRLEEEGNVSARESSAQSQEEEDISDWETDDEDEVIVNKQAELDSRRKPTRHAFIPAHPLFLSHAVSCDFSRLNTIIPNFIGGAIPRSDKGDRSFYCLTMMTLFKPWRSPADLKDSESTWDQIFNEHDFTPRQNELMRNFNVRYECNDARDDHFTTMKKKMAAAEAAGSTVFTTNIMGVKDDFAADLNEFDYGSDDEEMAADITDEQKGPRTLKLLAQAKEMKSILQNCGWLADTEHAEDVLPDDIDVLLPPFKRRTEWNNIVKHQRAQLIANKLADMPPVADLQNRRLQVENNAHAEGVTSIVTRFKLNLEQERAFRIVADHASTPQRMPLRMYLGGMGWNWQVAVFKIPRES